MGGGKGGEPCQWSSAVDALPGTGLPNTLAEPAALAAALGEVGLMRREANPRPGPGRASGTGCESRH